MTRTLFWEEWVFLRSGTRVPADALDPTLALALGRNPGSGTSMTDPGGPRMFAVVKETNDDARALPGMVNARADVRVSVSTLSVFQLVEKEKARVACHAHLSTISPKTLSTNRLQFRHQSIRPVLRLGALLALGVRLGGAFPHSSDRKTR